jgi:cytochrome P450
VSKGGKASVETLAMRPDNLTSTAPRTEPLNSVIDYPIVAGSRPWDRSGLRSWPGRLKIAGSRLNSAVKLGSDPEGFFESQRRRFGPAFWLWLPGVNPTLVIGTPSYAKQIFFQRGVDEFSTPRGQPLEPVFGEHSLVLNSGEVHRRHRSLMLPAFRRDRTEAFGDLMQQITRDAVGRLQPGQIFFALRLAQEISLRIIIRAIFGVTDPVAAKAMEAAVLEFLQTYTPRLMLLPFLRHRVLSVGQWTRFMTSRQRLDDLLEDHISLRRSDPSPGIDVLSQLIHMTDEAGRQLTNSELKDELRTLLVAGHDTTAAVVAWALYFLHAKLNLRERLFSELAPLGREPSPAQLHTLSFLEAVCQEALRLHPPVPLAVRQVKEPMKFGSYLVQTGENVAVSPRLLHTAEDVWDDACEFRPERFLERTYSAWEFAPFGGGTRRCIGAAFGSFELRVVLGTLMSCSEFKYAARSVPRARLRGIIISPDNEIPLRYCGPRIPT